jgi:hypothetical protein
VILRLLPGRQSVTRHQDRRTNIGLCTTDRSGRSEVPERS